MPLGFPVESFASALEYRAQPDDIFIATYPKCGTTWTQYILYLLLNQGVPLGANQRLGDAIPHLEDAGRNVVEALPRPRAIKTHLPYSMTPSNAEAKYVWVARNPFDCVVSFYNHTRGFDTHYDFSSGTFDDYFECFFAGEVDSGDYFDHLTSWWEHRNDPNVLFLTYEAMKMDTRKAILSISEFLRLSAASDEEVLSRTVEHSAIVNMRKDQGRWSSRRPKDKPTFVHKGIVGDWENYFSASQASRLVQKFEDAADVAGFGGLWPEVIEAAKRMS